MLTGHFAVAYDEHGFSPSIFSGLFGSYGVCVFRRKTKLTSFTLTSPPTSTLLFLQLRQLRVVPLHSFGRCRKICNVEECVWDNACIPGALVFNNHAAARSSA